MGYMDFLKQGHSNFELLKEFGLNLETPDSHLLDMGSGYGRLLAGNSNATSTRNCHNLTQIFTTPGIIVGGIDFKGNYTGMDILKRHVFWCQSSYRKYYARNVNFLHMDVFNSRYNTAGKIQPDVYTIPANDRTYSFVSLFSVFTHMHEEEILRYLSEFYR